jgi:hypothetical protein
MDPSTIQRVVRAGFPRLRRCYEAGLQNNTELRGMVSTKFVIDVDGTVPMTADAGSDLPDATVIRCVLRGFGVLRFPPPEGGRVTVVYPIMFAPGD